MELEISCFSNIIYIGISKESKNKKVHILVEDIINEKSNPPDMLGRMK